MRIGFIGCGPQAIEHAKAVQVLGHDVSLCAGSTGSSRTAHAFGDMFDCPVAPVHEVPEYVDRLVVSLPPRETEALNEYFFNDIRLPILMEKPTCLTFPYRYAKHITVGYNRRFLSSVMHLRNLIQFFPVEKYVFTINESVTEKMRRLDLSREEVYKYSTCHYIDLKNYLFPKQSRIEGDVVYLEDQPVNTSLTVYFKHKVVAVLSPLERLSVYTQMETRQGAFGRVYTPQLDYTVQEKIHGIKPGIAEQMRRWINNESGVADMLDEMLVFDEIEAMDLCSKVTY